MSESEHHQQFESRARILSPTPRNCWWVAASRNDLTAAPISRQLLGSRIVLARTSTGVLALEDRCPHRLARLSGGRIVDQDIECPYHGIRFNEKGQCTFVPGDPDRGSSLNVHAYVAVENGPFVWIWAGDSEKASAALLPDLNLPDEPTYFHFGGYRTIRCSSMVLLENFMDRTHVPFVHPTQFNDPSVPDQYLDNRLLSSNPCGDRSVRMTSRIQRHASGLEETSFGLRKGDLVEQTFESTVTLPSYWIQHSRMKPVSASMTATAHCSYWAVCATPISSNQCHCWWVGGRNFGRELGEFFRKYSEAEYENVLKEDAIIVEGVQSAIDEDGARRREMLVNSDLPIVQMRQTLRRMLSSR